MGILERKFGASIRRKAVAVTLRASGRLVTAPSPFPPPPNLDFIGTTSDLNHKIHNEDPHIFYKLPGMMGEPNQVLWTDR